MSEKNLTVGGVLARAGAIVLALSALVYFVVLAQRNTTTPRPDAAQNPPADKPAAAAPDGQRADVKEIEIPTFLSSSKSFVPSPTPADATKTSDEKKPASVFLSTSKSLVFDGNGFKKTHETRVEPQPRSTPRGSGKQ